METIELQQHDGVVKVILNRPQVRNAFNSKMIAEITSAMKTLSAQPELRCVQIVGAGKSFCAGADLEWMRSMVQFTQQQNLEDSQQLYDMFAAIKNIPAPVVVAVQGHAMGGALGILATADIVIAEDQAEFCFSEAKLGLAPAVISAFVKDKISISSMNHLFLTAAIFGAQHAKSVGLVHSVVAADQLETELQTITEQICHNGPLAIRATKKLIQHISHETDTQLKKTTTELIAHLRVSTEGQEGIQSFLQRREPTWRTNLENP